MSEDSPQGQENKQVRATPNTNMLLQFRGTLLATIDAVTVEDLSNPMIRKKYELTRELLAKDKADFTWNDAYQLEKLAVHLRPCVDLKVELKKTTKRIARTRSRMGQRFTRMTLTLSLY